MKLLVLAATFAAGVIIGSVVSRALLRRRIRRAAERLDMRLLRKLARGEGGTRTGALQRAGLLSWKVTPAGFDALADIEDSKGRN